MAENDWWIIKNFKKSEFKYPQLMAKDLTLRLDLMREVAGKPFTITSCYREGDGGYHGLGLAVDGRFKDMPLIDQFLLAIRYFNGVGVYNSYWKGIHIDMRPLKKYEPKALWSAVWDGKKQVYGKLDSAFFKSIIEV